MTALDPEYVAEHTPVSPVAFERWMRMRMVERMTADLRSAGRSESASTGRVADLATAIHFLLAPESAADGVCEALGWSLSALRERWVPVVRRRLAQEPGLRDQLLAYPNRKSKAPYGEALPPGFGARMVRLVEGG